ncbi:hypothetical protein ACOR62_06305 [Neisseria lisongii]|nr:hypothetical protein [Neisseria lisongii]
MPPTQGRLKTSEAGFCAAKTEGFAKTSEAGFQTALLIFPIGII